MPCVTRMRNALNKEGRVKIIRDSNWLDFKGMPSPIILDLPLFFHPDPILRVFRELPATRRITMPA